MVKSVAMLRRSIPRWTALMVTTTSLAMSVTVACGPGKIGDLGPAAASVEPKPIEHGGDVKDNPYVDFQGLHERAVQRTCTLNNGVCHNSRQIPDLHTTSAFIATVGQPCNILAETHAAVKDACEPDGDRLVVPSKGIDVEITRMEVKSADYSLAAYDDATVMVSKPVAVSAGDAADVFITRRDEKFFFEGAKLAGGTGVAGDRVTLHLRDATEATRFFFNDTKYPWNPSMVRVADVNANGVRGRTLGISMLTPGDPMKSFVVLRLFDETQGELMPLQCREWDNLATIALGCWIEGMKTDASGHVTNAEAPIDYAKCVFKDQLKATMGRCSATAGSVGAVLSRGCAGTGCHVSEKSPAAGLDLTEGKWKESLVGRASPAGPIYVVPGKPDDSYILCKLSDTCASRHGARMPLNQPALPKDSIDVIRSWIAAGAL